MKIYTQIFIGMGVGAIIGFTLGPQSALLEKDMIPAADPSTIVFLHSPGGTADDLRLPPKVPVQLKIVEQARRGEQRFYRVSFKVTRQQALRDSSARLKQGSRIQLWVDAAQVSPPASALGTTLMGWLAPIGQIFIRLIKMVIIPLVFASLLVGVASLGDIRKLGRLGGKTMGYFMITTTCAISIGLVGANLIKPGKYIVEAERTELLSQYGGDASAKTQAAAEQPSTIDHLLTLIPENPAQAMTNGDMLQVIFFAIFFGLALTLLPDQKSQRVVDFFDSISDAMVMCVQVIMKLAPYGVLALIANVVGQSGASVLLALTVYALVVLGCLLMHAFAVYTLVVRFIAKIKPQDFWRAIRPAQLIAFSTSSSSATLPVTMECAEKRLGISNQIAAFVLPLGSTINMDGTALYQGVAAVFIAQVFNIPLSFGDQMNVVLTATLASIGAAGVPGVGMITLALVLTSIGVPTVGVALILGVDRILDMFRTAVNVTGDLSAAAMIASSEGESLQFIPPE